MSHSVWFNIVYNMSVLTLHACVAGVYMCTCAWVSKRGGVGSSR